MELSWILLPTQKHSSCGLNDIFGNLQSLWRKSQMMMLPFENYPSFAADKKSQLKAVETAAFMMHIAQISNETFHAVNFDILLNWFQTNELLFQDLDKLPLFCPFLRYLPNSKKK